jgi:hypothetical protein
MASFADWIPLRWQAGPLDSAAPELARPESLHFLKSSPINCLVVNWQAGGPQDEAQRKALTRLLGAARSQGLAVVGLVKNAAHQAKEAGLAALISDVALPDADGLPVFTSKTSGEIKADVVVARKALWPRIPGAWRTEANRQERADAGPTGAAWVDSNGWLASLIQAKAPNSILWLAPELPKETSLLRPEHYQLAAADAAVYGARWVVDLDADLRSKLANQDARALSSWRQIAKALEHFRKLEKPAPVQAKLVLVSDLQGPEEHLAGEILNLAARRHLQVRPELMSNLTAPKLDGVTTLMLLHNRSLTPELHSVLKSFIDRGGLVIVPASFALPPSGLTPAGNHDQRYDLYSAGKGRIAMARKPWNDPYQIALDAHLLMSRKQDVVRLWNAGSTNVRYSGSAGNGKVEVLNYAARPMGHPMSVWVASPYKSAVLVPLAGERTSLEITPKNGGTEVALPPFPVYAAVEFRG